EMSQLENCIRGLLGRSVALNLTNRHKKKKNSFFHSSYDEQKSFSSIEEHSTKQVLRQLFQSMSWMMFS
ncbi:hypothetical protein, partial [Exiguobacterium antarcticum]